MVLRGSKGQCDPATKAFVFKGSDYPVLGPDGMFGVSGAHGDQLGTLILTPATNHGLRSGQGLRVSADGTTATLDTDTQELGARRRRHPLPLQGDHHMRLTPRTAAGLALAGALLVGTTACGGSSSGKAAAAPAPTIGRRHHGTTGPAVAVPGLNADVVIAGTKSATIKGTIVCS